ncbi:uncharacterized protein LOC133547472 isoform X4 [Nerophis ophidion]|uniref:uncharacterized protein LOC133547254 isoform X4 n=1 Tax=Nerophis ophidion TaxID=159077 RepID=UPI002ADF95DD|nr:uncharacterized protein LOC133547254 isoform X4 [Nerophis ophidion]XP_061749142.1 uncharacterized protein LOC133547472 isoform X4 [Nerophis ophidion]
MCERTIAEYEEELSRTKDDNMRLRQLLEAVFKKPQVVLHRTAVKEAAVTFLTPPWLPSETLAVTTPLRLSDLNEAHRPREQEEEPQSPHIHDEEKGKWRTH